MDGTNVKTLELQQEVLELRRRVKKLKVHGLRAADQGFGFNKE
jgi:hypothetical protein